MHPYLMTIEYLSEFFSTRYGEYFFEMRNVGNPHMGQEAFDGEEEIVQGIRNIVFALEDEYSDLTIPKGFASPEHLHEALLSLVTMAHRQLERAKKIQQNIESPQIPAIDLSIRINSEVRSAVNHALTLANVSANKQETCLARLNNILMKLPSIARRLKIRRNEGGTPRDTLVVKDEYDLQDLLNAVLILEFDDIRPEEWCPSYAGGSNRTDFLLKNEKIVIEVKHTRSDHNQKKIGEELIIDIAKYKSHPDCEYLVCYVWDFDHKIDNAMALKNDLETSNNEFVTVHICQSD